MARQLPKPDICEAGQFRLTGALAAGTAIAAATNYREVIAVRGAALVRVYAKTVTAGGTLKLSAIESVSTDDTSPLLANGAIDPAKVTAITAGAPADVTLVAGTPNVIEFSPDGENYLLVTITGGGVGTIGYTEVCKL